MSFTSETFCIRCFMNINMTNITSAAVFHFASVSIREEFIELKKQFNLKKWRVKSVLFAILKKVLIIFTTNIENVNNVISKEV